MDEVLAKILRNEEIGGPIKMLGELTNAGPITALAAELEWQEGEIVGKAIQDGVRTGLFLCMAALNEDEGALSQRLKGVETLETVQAEDER